MTHFLSMFHSRQGNVEADDRWPSRPFICKAGHQGRAEGQVATWLIRGPPCILRRCLSPRLSPLCLRVRTTHHPTRKGWKGAYVLALRGVTTKYALQSWRKIPPPPHVIVVGLCTHRHTGVTGSPFLVAVAVAVLSGGVVVEMRGVPCVPRRHPVCLCCLLWSACLAVRIGQIQSKLKVAISLFFVA